MALLKDISLENINDKEKNELLDHELQDFARQVGVICALEAGGKIDSVQAYKKIKLLFKELKTTKRTLYPKAVPNVDPDKDKS